jgi:hypothetical protein
MLVSIISLLFLAMVLFINRPLKKRKKETTFKVDLGRSVELVSWSRLQYLTEEEKSYLFKKAKGCTSFSEELPTLNLDNVTKFQDCFESVNGL